MTNYENGSIRVMKVGRCNIGSLLIPLMLSILQVMPCHSDACFKSNKLPIPEESKRFRLYKSSRAPAIPLSLDGVEALQGSATAESVSSARTVVNGRHIAATDTSSLSTNAFNATSDRPRPNGMAKPAQQALTHGRSSQSAHTNGVDQPSPRTHQQEHAILRQNPLFQAYYLPGTPQSRRLVEHLGVGDLDEALQKIAATDPHELRQILLDVALGRKIAAKQAHISQPQPARPEVDAGPTQAIQSKQRIASLELPEPVNKAPIEPKVAVGQVFGTTRALRKAVQALSERNRTGSVIQLEGDTSVQCRYYGRKAPIT